MLRHQKIEMLLVHQRPKIDDKEVVGVGSFHRRDPDINIYLDKMNSLNEVRISIIPT